MNEFPPFLRAKAVPGVEVRPDTVAFLPPGKKLRIGYHPPHMDNVVGSPEFSRLPFQDVRGDPEAEKGISRHVACIWRDKETDRLLHPAGLARPGRADPAPGADPGAGRLRAPPGRHLAALPPEAEQRRPPLVLRRVRLQAVLAQRQDDRGGEEDQCLQRQPARRSDTQRQRFRAA